MRPTASKAQAVAFLCLDGAPFANQTPTTNIDTPSLRRRLCRSKMDRLRHFTLFVLMVPLASALDTLHGSACELQLNSFLFGERTQLSRTVCKPGTVHVDAHLTNALETQRELSKHLSVCNQPWISTHNSAIAEAYGFGTWDSFLSHTASLMEPYFEAFLALLGSDAPFEAKVQTANQHFSVGDQLNMGVRSIEVDAKVVDDKLVIGHCGRVSDSRLASVKASLARYKGVVGDLLAAHAQDALDVFESIFRDISNSENGREIGCKPSGSGLPYKDHFSATAIFREVAEWLTGERGKDEVLLLYIDNDTGDEVEGFLVRAILQEIPREWLFTTEDFANVYASDWEKVTRASLARSGRKMIVLVNSDPQNIRSPIFFTKRAGEQASFCQGLPGTSSVRSFKPAPQCELSLNGNVLDLVAEARSQTPAGGRIRMWQDNIRYGPLDSGFRAVDESRQLTDELVEKVNDCGVFHIGMDGATEHKVKRFVWSWMEGHPQRLPGLKSSTSGSNASNGGGDAQDLIAGSHAKDGVSLSISATGEEPSLSEHGVCTCLINAELGRETSQGSWISCECSHEENAVNSSIPIACRRLKEGERDEWLIASRCPGGYTFSVPRSRSENDHLRRALQMSDEARVLLNFRQIAPEKLGEDESQFDVGDEEQKDRDGDVGERDDISGGTVHTLVGMWAVVATFATAVISQGLMP